MNSLGVSAEFPFGRGPWVLGLLEVADFVMGWGCWALPAPRSSGEGW